MRPACVSIHAPVRGATGRKASITYAEAAVSIHAPVRGATLLRMIGSNATISFNPRARAGRD